jgi:DNA-binding response OmpR family regulator
VEKDVLVLGAHAPEMELLRARLGRMGYRAVPAKTPDQARSFLRVAGGRIGAVIVPSDLPVMNLRSALLSLRTIAGGDELVFLAGGRDPGAEGRRKLREAGVDLAVFDPCDPHTLRFQVNRALSDERRIRGRRRTVRAPADWPVAIRAGDRIKEGRIYSISAGGAFVTLQQPCMTRARVTLDLAVPSSGRVHAQGRVVMTNVPGNVMRRSLPFGMGVQFDNLSEAVSVSLLVYAQERFRSLSL